VNRTDDRAVLDRIVFFPSGRIFGTSDMSLDGGASVTVRTKMESAPEPAAADRLRYLKAFAEHAALAAAFRLLRRPAARQQLGDRALRAVFFSAYPRSHYGTVSRLSRWIPHLERLGCEAEILTPTSDPIYAAFRKGDSAADLRYFESCLRNRWRDVRRAAKADVMVVHRGLFPFSPWQRANFERDLARLNPRLVYDFYDAIWLQRQEAGRQPSRIGRWLHPQDKIEQIIKLARVVTVSNALLAEFARQYHSDVRIMPMLLDVDDYTPRRHEQRSPVVLGWLGNHYQIPRLLSLAPALRKLAETRQILVRVVTSETVDIPGVPVDSRTHPWTPESERDDLAQIDIGLLPLDYSIDDRGKSPLKALQYSAAGLPFVATPVALDLSVMKPGESFLSANSNTDWLACLTRLVDDPALRARLGAAARLAVITHYSFASHAPTFLSALQDAASQKPTCRRRNELL
jgi:glycosyltransferase involved in cell wall biosynthesis